MASRSLSLLIVAFLFNACDSSETLRNERQQVELQTGHFLKRQSSQADVRKRAVVDEKTQDGKAAADGSKTQQQEHGGTSQKEGVVDQDKQKKENAGDQDRRDHDKQGKAGAGIQEEQKKEETIHQDKQGNFQFATANLNELARSLDKSLTKDIPAEMQPPRHQFRSFPEPSASQYAHRDGMMMGPNAESAWASLAEAPQTGNDAAAHGWGSFGAMQMATDAPGRGSMEAPGVAAETQGWGSFEGMPTDLPIRASESSPRMAPGSGWGSLGSVMPSESEFVNTGPIGSTFSHNRANISEWAPMPTASNMEALDMEGGGEPMPILGGRYLQRSSMMQEASPVEGVVGGGFEAQQRFLKPHDQDESQWKSPEERPERPESPQAMHRHLYMGEPAM